MAGRRESTSSSWVVETQIAEPNVGGTESGGRGAGGCSTELMQNAIWYGGERFSAGKFQDNNQREVGSRGDREPHSQLQPEGQNTTQGHEWPRERAGNA